YVEHRYSFLELSRIFSTLKAEHLAQSKLAAAKQAEAKAK
ncbi:lipoprotein NlpI, partial [Vibrio sp. 10N.222.55.E8]